MFENEYIGSLRKEYSLGKIEPNDLSSIPSVTFKGWLDFALHENVPEVNAMVLSTISDNNKPTSRIVLLKDIEESGLVFFTNYNSKKGRNLEENPNACVNFFWPQLERQIRIEGRVQKLDREASEAYFHSRPRLSQAGAIVSRQSAEIDSRDPLDEEVNRLMNLPVDQILERPENWGGYLLVPDYFEFWQGRPGRVHDRIVYELTNGNWRKFRLSP